MGSGSIAYRNSPQILYGIGLPGKPSGPEVQAPGNGGDNINNINNINNPPDPPQRGAGRPGACNEALAHLMRNIGRKTWNTVGRADFERLSEDVLKQFVPDPKNGRRREDVEAWFKAFEAAADGIQKRLKSLSAYSVREMAMALKHVRDFAAKPEVAQPPTNKEKIMAAELTSFVESLYDLSADLRALCRALKLPNLRSRFDDMIFTLDSRASELDILGRHLAEMADQIQGEEGERGVIDFSKGMGGVMHGNYESVVSQSSSKVVKMAETVEGLRNRGKVVTEDGEEMQGVLESVDAAKEELGDGSENSKKISSTMSPKVFDALKTDSRLMSDRLHKRHAIATYATRLRFAKSIPNVFTNCLKKGVRPEDLKRCPTFGRLIRLHDDFVKALEDYAQNRNEETYARLNEAAGNYDAHFKGDALKDTLLDLCSELADLGSQHKLSAAGVRLRNDLLYVSSVRGSSNKERAKMVAMAIFGTPSVGRMLFACSTRVLNVGKKTGSGRFLADDILSILEGGGKLSDVLLASMYGIDAKWIDPGLQDKNCVSSEFLCAGGGNTVVKLEYRVPVGGSETRSETIVFKPDFLATVGNARLTLYTDGYVGSQQALQLNIASGVIAKGLGCEDRLTKTRALFNENRLGIGMSFAPGKSANKAYRKMKEKGGAYVLLKSKNQAERDRGLRTVNDLAHQTTDLQWLDLLAGQGDRHQQNYNVDVDATTGKAVVTGIDNDMCMPITRTGLTRLKLSQELMTRVRTGLVETAKSCKKYFAGVTPDEVADLTMSEYFNADGEIDFGRPDLPPELVTVLCKSVGCKSLAVPTVMSQAMYDKLKAIADNPGGPERQGLVADLKGLLPEENVRAFESRLDELLDLVKSGRILVVPEATAENPTPWLAKDVQVRLRRSANYYSVRMNSPKDGQYAKVLESAYWKVCPFLFRDFPGLADLDAVKGLAGETNVNRVPGYAKLPEKAKEFLQEVARMSYGVGDGKEKGGGGHIGLQENPEDGSLRVFKYNTHWSERRWKFGKNPATREMKESSNALRKKLVAIARMSGLGPAKVVQIRRMLGLKGDAETSEALLDRTTVAEVLEIIGGRALWRDAVPPGDRMERYASEKDMSFARVFNWDVDRNGNGHAGLGKRLGGLRSYTSAQFKGLLGSVKGEFLGAGRMHLPAKASFEEVVSAAFSEKAVEKLVRDHLGAVSEEDVRKRITACLEHVWNTVRGGAVTAATKSRLANECYALIVDEGFLKRTRPDVGEDGNMNIGG